MLLRGRDPVGLASRVLLKARRKGKLQQARTLWTFLVFVKDRHNYRDTKCKTGRTLAVMAGNMERHARRHDHANPNLDVGHVQSGLEQGGTWPRLATEELFLWFSIRIRAKLVAWRKRSFDTFFFFFDVVNLGIWQVEEAMKRLDKWQDKKEPLLKEWSIRAKLCFDAALELSSAVCYRNSLESNTNFELIKYPCDYF